MKWNRRTFIKFIMGAILGIHTSPLIPKFFKDSSIWTQNWKWIPNPEAGTLAFANSINPSTGSGVRARLIQSRLTSERIISIEGNPEYPITNGGVVPADISAVQLLYNDEIRIKTPLLLNKKNKIYKEITWDNSLNIIAQKMEHLLKTNKSYSLGILGENQKNLVGEILIRFMNAYGSQNLAFYPSADYTLAKAGWAMFGQTNLGFDLTNASYIISFGTPLLEGFGAPVALHKALTEWKKNKSYLVQVEPRCSITSSQADLFLACKPGTEALLALGICFSLIQQNLVDEEATKSFGWNFFENFLIQNYNTKKIAEITGVSTSNIIQVAKNFAKTPNAVAVCGPGSGGDPGQLSNFMAILSLNALKNNLGKIGGLVIRDPIKLTPLGPDIINSSDNNNLITNNLFNITNSISLAKSSLSNKIHKIEMLIITGGNPAYTGPEVEIMNNFLHSTPFVITISPMLNETTALADLILPSTTFLETWGDCTSPYGSALTTYGITRPLVTPYPQAKGAADILLTLANNLGGSISKALPYKTGLDALKTRISKLGNINKLIQKSYYIQDNPSYNFTLKTPSGKIDFLSQNLANLYQKKYKINSTITFFPQWDNKVTEEYTNDYPLFMMAIPSLRSGSTITYEPLSPYMLKILNTNTLRYKNELVIEINPQTAANLNLKEDDKITIISINGSSINALVHLYSGATPNTIFVPTGLGHNVISDSYTLNKGDNYYRIAETQIDTLSETVSWNLTKVKIFKRK